MPDIREVSLLIPAEAGQYRWGKRLSQVKFAIRWAVVVTARTPLAHLYRAIYRAHAWYALRVAKRFPGTRAIYLTRSMATGDIAFGISDIDMVILGEWPEEEQIRLMRALGTLSAISPLYDSGLWQQVHGIENLRDLWETDYFFQSRFDEGRTQWKLVHGDDLVANLPAVPQERLGGGYYMEVRSWWLHFIASVFGSGPTASDSIFRNSIAYKAVTEILGIARAQRLGTLRQPRQAYLRASIEEATGSLRGFLQRLERSASDGHLRFSGDIQAEAVGFLLPCLDELHARLASMPSFEKVGDFEIDAQAEEVLLTPAALEHARALVEHAKGWPGYRSAALAPSAACFAVDDLLLLIEVNPEQLPSLTELRELCRLHSAKRGTLRQRISLYLLLGSGACQLEFVNFTEMWRVMVFPPSTPDLFSLMNRQGFRLDGEPKGSLPAPVWSRFARDLAIEELTVRRRVLARVTPDVFPSSIEIVRNVYRHLQLEILVWTSQRGSARFALSPPAIERELRGMGFSDHAVLGALAKAYEQELAGETTDVRPLVPQIMAFLGKFTWKLP